LPETPGTRGALNPKARALQTVPQFRGLMYQAHQDL
jgi:hypothetical protein